MDILKLEFYQTTEDYYVSMVTPERWDAEGLNSHYLLLDLFSRDRIKFATSNSADTGPAFSSIITEGTGG